jgi:predicted outer membrane protein
MRNGFLGWGLVATFTLAVGIATAQNAPPRVAQPVGAQGSNADQQIAACIYGLEHNEVEISKFAESRLQSPEAKQFAQQMVKDHTQDGDQYKQIAGNLINAQGGDRAGGQLDWVSIHKQLGEQCLKSTKEELGRQQQGADFDKGFMACQIEEHLQAKDKLTVLRSHASPQLQQHLDKSLQAVNTHLQHARQIMEQLKERPSERVSRKTDSK